jgi:hypothetical protein
MKASILVLASLLSSANTFTAGPTVSKKNTALKDVAVLDPEMINGALQTGGDQMVMAARAVAGAAAVAFAAAASATMGKAKGSSVSSVSSSSSAVTAEPEPEIIDISIPYNAAAKLAFAETKLSSSQFQEFETLYLAKTVADVTVKKMARDMEETVKKMARDVEEMKKVATKLAQDMESLSS